MPKLRKTDQEIREEELYLAIAQAKVKLNLPYDADLADLLGLSKAAYSCRKRRGLYQSFGLDKVSKLFRALHLTGRQVCRIVGIPYEA